MFLPLAIRGPLFERFSPIIIANIVPDMVEIALQLLPYLIMTTTLGGRCYYYHPHFTDDIDHINDHLQ